jgi:hypothetical protein
MTDLQPAETMVNVEITDKPKSKYGSKMNRFIVLY